MKFKIILTASACIAMLTGCGAGTTLKSKTGNVASTTTAAAGQSAANTVGTNPGQIAPDFSLQTLDHSKTVSLKSLLGHQFIFVNAWASWCHPCQVETPDLVKLSKMYAGKVQFVGVNMTSTERSVSDATKFVRQYNVPYMVLQDPKSAFLNTYNLQGFPDSYLIAPSGKIIESQQGILLSGELKTWIDTALKKT